MTLLCAAAAWSLYKHGRWRDYLTLGLLEGLLFHTHQLSALVFAMTCLVLAPRVLSHSDWFRKSASAAAIAILLTVPWAIYCGFFSAASGLPKAHELFSSNRDWFEYLLERPAGLSLVVGMMVLLGCYCILERLGLKHLEQASSRLKIYFFLTLWSLLAYFSFQFLVPAASYFYERLTLIVLVPVACFIGMTLAELVILCKRPVQIVLSIALPLLILAFLKDLPFYKSNLKSELVRLAEVVQHIDEICQKDDAPLRIYATPNNQLVWSYYTGLPVQSIAPIRPSFLEEYQGGLLYLQESMLLSSPKPTELELIPDQSTEASEIPPLAERTSLIRTHWIGRQLDSKGLRQWRKNAPPLPANFEPAMKAFDDKAFHAQYEYVQTLEDNPIFRNLGTNSLHDTWMCFYYRFVNFENRIGMNANIRPFLEDADITILSYAGVIAYYIPYR